MSVEVALGAILGIDATVVGVYANKKEFWNRLVKVMHTKRRSEIIQAT